MRELGKAAFVTGGASGIGLALGHALAAAGMKVMLADVDAPSLASAVLTRAVAAIQNDELYVFTHPERRPDLQARFSAILAAFDGTPTEQAVIPR